MLRQERQRATAILTLDYPQRRNALAVAMREQMVAALEGLEADASLRAIVLTGSGAHFSAGGDISGMNVTDLAGGRERFRTTHKLVRLLIESSKPVIAAVEGWCVGAGLGLALCCDTVVAAADARFSTGFGKIGLVADFGLLHTLPRRIGEGRARQLLLRNTVMAADEALRVGLIDETAPPGGALAAAMAIAGGFAEGAPLPVAMTKSYLAQGLADALEWERNTQSALFLTGDHAEGKAAFLGKRAAVFRGV